MKQISQYISESTLKIKAPYNIERDGLEYHLVIDDKDADGNPINGFKARYVSNDNSTLVTFEEKHLQDLEKKITRYILNTQYCKK